MKKISLLSLSLMFASQFSFTLNAFEFKLRTGKIDASTIIPVIQATNCITIPAGIIHGVFNSQIKIESLIKNVGKGAFKGAHVGTVAGLFLASCFADQLNKNEADREQYDLNEKINEKEFDKEYDISSMIGPNGEYTGPTSKFANKNKSDK